jgi:legumain
MTSNDVPFAKENPFPGTLFNKPTYNKEGVNVYEGLVVDYSGNDVTPQNFINVLLGNQGSMEGIGSGRVLNSTHQDHVFIYYSDHGGAGLIAFPAGGYLFSD